MSTKLTSEWKVPSDYMHTMGMSANQEETIEQLIQQDIELFLHDVNQSAYNSDLLSLLNTCFTSLLSHLNTQRWVQLAGDIYFDKKAKGYWLIKDQERLYGHYDSGEELSYVEEDLNNKIGDKLNEWSIPNKSELLCLTNLSGAPFKTFNKRPIATCYYLYDLKDQVQAFDTDQDYLDDANSGSVIPFLPLDTNDISARSLFIDILTRGFVPKVASDNPEYQLLFSVFHRNSEHSYNDMNAEANRLLGDLIKNIIATSILAEDKIRADISPYHEKVLQDTQLGHWALWQDELDTTELETIHIPTKFVARDPKSSINDGVVAIDFGTKSTVVVYQKDNVNIHPMRIGTGDLSKEIDAYHYENPTIMEFKDLESFITAYDAKANKPYTRWQDLTISHTAHNSMQGSESHKFNTFLDEIKQWAGDKSRKLKIVGQKGRIIDLPPFLELSDEDFNPIEIYAYYLGLYINNLNNGIFMDYILSFPVTYEVPIRDKIIESFHKGLTKSLPAELGEDTIAQLTVTKGASEPAAYALTALKAHAFDPEDNERVFYSVFDFGGGTTDFDFGIFREATGRKERRFDYAIEHFGAGGDKFLGGENLLELLAFEVFKKNKSALLEKGIQFEKHPEKDAFAGSEQLLSNSQEARTNTKQLCIALRPFWEEHEEFAFDASGELSVTLTDVHGVQHSAFALDIDEQELNEILSDRIERGVENFFDALRLAFSQSHQMLADIDSVKIFLAGNSSQSRFVQELFEKHIALQHEEMGLTEGAGRFELFAPLGADKNDVEKPTGKTGVAFGLIESREGGRIKVIDHNVGKEDIRFKFYLGENRKNKFKPLVDREVAFDQWIEFTDAYYKKFEIFFTDQPSSSTGQVSIADSSIKKKAIKLDTTDDEALVYIRAVSPTRIEYVVANEDGIVNNVYLNDIQSIEL
ncbi:molecular chaperone DnaK [Vibrio sp. CAU 1672]|uniref:molecular chaperone DnaK n=1 Tax=Vibrio sp. CAU 1672 TaxID=3032594 RepID=UPI0023DB863A|nr:molecular chaperone DnaK [Vibrio sp. CAU 1672]MDF2154516.1 molecular chaperone DnaK [Vibrio sp. CAU 1672]